MAGDLLLVVPGGSGAVHAMAATSEVDGSRRWTPRAARDGTRRQGRVGGRTAHSDRYGRMAQWKRPLRADDAVKAVAVASR